jgi:hypothetical protein
VSIVKVFSYFSNPRTIAAAPHPLAIQRWVLLERAPRRLFSPAKPWHVGAQSSL